MNKTLEQVKEFMLMFKQPVQPITHQIQTDRARLRLSLLLEETHELAVAYGEDRYFKDMCHSISTKPTYTDSPNRVEELDALVDIQYVLNGAVLEGGLGDCFDEAFDEVHANNMTKAASTIEEANASILKYGEKNILVVAEEHNNKFIIFDVHTRKALKAANYVPVDLSGILNRFIANFTAQKSMEI
jgi:predicted HAD superfamily Cof-like phosphohydrolase